MTLRREHVAHVVRHCPRLTLRFPGTDDQIVGDGGQGGEEDDGPKEEVREGDKKVVFCQRIVTDASGRAQVEVTLPPQTGRVMMRVVAAQKLEFAQGQSELDVKRVAGAEARLPRSFVPGAELHVPMAQVALAWVLRNPVVNAPIVGPTKAHHLTDAVAALDVHLTVDEVAALEAPYRIRPAHV